MRNSTTAIRIIAALAILLGASGALHAQEPESADQPSPLRILHLTGGGWHDYETQQHILSQGVEARINAKVDIVFTDEPGFEGMDWIEGYDAVLHNHCWAGMEPEAQAIMAERVKEAHAETGVGAVLLHCAMATFRDAPAWFEFTGVDMYDHEPHYPFTVMNFRPDHPLMKPFGAEWDTPQGELYNIIRVLPNTNPLAIAYGRERSKQYEIVIWTNEYEGVPIFATTIGHHNETMEQATYLDLVARGVLYVTGKLGDDGQPVEGYDAE